MNTKASGNFTQLMIALLNSSDCDTNHNQIICPIYYIEYTAKFMTFLVEIVRTLFVQRKCWTKNMKYNIHVNLILMHVLLSQKGASLSNLTMIILSECRFPSNRQFNNSEKQKKSKYQMWSFVNLNIILDNGQIQLKKTSSLSSTLPVCI